MNLSKHTPAVVGLKQALATAIYIVLVASFMNYMGKVDIEPEGSTGIIFMLLLLVISAGTCGLLIFGYPVYLIINKENKRAMSIFGYTFLYLLLFLVIAGFIVFSFAKK